MKIIEPSTHDEYRRYYELRWKILRAPWNQPRGSEQDALDRSSSHFMVIDSQQVIIGVGRLQFNSIREAQIRYMAIDIEQQRRGIGTRLLHVLEDRAIELGAASIVLDAREQALGFYRKQGYELEGPGHVLFNTIPHVKMSKRLMSAG
jgi:ribosomal protein S18 acetylase RimI-like enzyme